jgi:hypothetical protein
VSVVADPAGADGLYDLVTEWVGGASLAAAAGKVATRAPGLSATSYADPEPRAPDLAVLARPIVTAQITASAPSVAGTLNVVRERSRTAV